MTFSNKEEPKVQLSLELKLSVIGWVKWVISLSLLENKKWNNDQLFAVVREQLIQWSAGQAVRAAASLHHYDGLTGSSSPQLPGDLTGCLTYLTAGLLACWSGIDI